MSADANGSSSLPQSVGFVGLGAMGKPMVINLARKLPAGSHIYVHDVVAAAANELCDAFPDVLVRGASARQVAEESDVVLTMLPEGAHVRSVYLDETTGIIAALSAPRLKPLLLIDSSTIDTATSLHVREQLTAASSLVSFYDAPVSGGVSGAEQGTLAFYVGCAPADDSSSTFDTELSPLLRLMGATVIACGGPALGLAAKLSNNYLSGIITIACAEAMDMGMRAGIDASVLASVFGAGTAQNAICDRFNPVPGVCAGSPASRGYNGGFRVQLMRKDLGLAVDMAARLGARNALGMPGFGVYAAASEAPACRDKDSRVVYRFLGGKED